jgi:hypothetical protein
VCLEFTAHQTRRRASCTSTTEGSRDLAQHRPNADSMFLLNRRHLRVCERMVATALSSGEEAQPIEGKRSGHEVPAVREGCENRCVVERLAHTKRSNAHGHSCGSAPTDAMDVVYLLCSVRRPVSSRVAGTRGCYERPTRTERAISAPPPARPEPKCAA